MSPAKTARPPGRPKALSHDAVVEAIRRGILANDLVPRQRLVEAELCKLLGASRGNVRSALIELEHEGLIERVVNRGARVRSVGLEEALQIAEVRMVVESLCVFKAAEKITDPEVKELRELGKQLKERAEHGDAAGFAEVTHKIYLAYVRIADQPVAAEMLERLRALNTRHRFRLTYRPGRAKVAAPFWLEIIDAICKREPAAARRALQRHAENVQQAMKALAQDDTPFGTIAREPAARDAE
jgi:DNA-binding GntR family transcriptional regulator